MYFCRTLYFRSKSNQMHNISHLFYFGTTLYMFRTVFPSIIRSLSLYIQRQVHVIQRQVHVIQRHVHVTQRQVHVIQRQVHVIQRQVHVIQLLWLLAATEPV